MLNLDDIGARLGTGGPPDTLPAADEMLALGEAVLCHWLIAHDKVPGDAKKEGFRLLGLHRQAAKGDPSFNACRETARELAYHYNLISMNPDHPETPRRLEMMRMVALHLYLFISGKLQVAGLGEFCCASRPLRLEQTSTPH